MIDTRPPDRATSLETDGDSAAGFWKRTLWFMVFVQFVMSASQTITSPILPLFLPELGVTTPSSVEFWSGVLTSLNFLVAVFVSPLWGSMADRYGRKMMVLRSSLASCLFMAAMGFSQELWQLVVLRALMGAFSGFSAAAIALVATQVPGQRLGYALGWLSTGQLVGGLIGPLAGGLIADYSGSYRIVFFCTSITAALAVTIAWLGVTERFSRKPAQGKGSAFAGFAVVLRTPSLLPLFLVLLMAQFGVRAVQPVVTPFVQDLVGSVPSLATLAGFAFSVTGIADVLVSPFLGKRSDSIGYRRVLLISLFGAMAASVPQAFVDGYWQFVALRFALGMFVGGILPTANALVGRLVAPSHRGLAYGVTASATFLGSFLGPFTGGSVAAAFGIHWVFLVTGALFLANFLWVFRVVPEVDPDGLPKRGAVIKDVVPGA
jgi:DHA1 family multidrug resistance protein-like MFS transporter